MLQSTTALVFALALPSSFARSACAEETRSTPSDPSATTEAAPPAVRPGERRSPAAMTGGIVLTSLGGLGMLYVGATAMGGCADDCETRTNVARGTVVGAVVALAVGIPLLIYGAKRVPSVSADAEIAAMPKWAGAPTPEGWGWAF